MHDDALTIRLDGPYLEMLALKHGGYCCSQIVVKLILSRQGHDNPDLVRAMAALCNGTGGVCGILTGAACALSLGLADAPGQELPDSLLPLLLDELSGWFAATAERSYGGTSCERILEASPDKRACTLLLAATLEKVESILATEGSSRKEGRV